MLRQNATFEIDVTAKSHIRDLSFQHSGEAQDDRQGITSRSRSKYMNAFKAIGTNVLIQHVK